MKLSIITINYNNKVGLQRTIDSVICQTWRDFEWIVIDGGSTDGSKELIEQYQEYFSYWCSEPDKGVYNAMNKGIAKAKGEYMQFLNSGDRYHNSSVLKHIKVELDGADVVYGDLNYISEKGNYFVSYPEELTNLYFLLHSIGHPASFIRSELLKERGYREDLRIVSDWYRFFEWFREGKSFHHVHIIVADYDTTGISSLNLDLISKENEIVFRELFGEANLELVEECRKMQSNHEHPCMKDFLNIMGDGGLRWKVLFRLLQLIKE